MTSDGLKILPLVQSLCNEFSRLQEQINELHGLESGLIRIGTFSSVATHWLPNIIKEFQKDYPKIDYEFLLGDYSEIEDWILSGRVDCGFLSLPAHPDLETMFLEDDKLMVVTSQSHPLAKCRKFPLSALEDYPFMLLEKGDKTEISRIFEENGLSPDIKFTTWDDYAIMSMVESGLGISILPKLILKKTPYKIAARELEGGAMRKIGLAFRSKERLPIAVKKFIEYLKYR